MSVARDSPLDAQCLWGYTLAGLVSAVGGSHVCPPLVGVGIQGVAP